MPSSSTAFLCNGYCITEEGVSYFGILILERMSWVSEHVTNEKYLRRVREQRQLI